MLKLTSGCVGKGPEGLGQEETRGARDAGTGAPPPAPAPLQPPTSLVSRRGACWGLSTELGQTQQAVTV